MLRPLDLVVVGCDDDASGLAMVMVRCMVNVLHAECPICTLKAKFMLRQGSHLSLPQDYDRTDFPSRLLLALLSFASCAYGHYYHLLCAHISCCQSHYTGSDIYDSLLDSSALCYSLLLE